MSVAGARPRVHRERMLHALAFAVVAAMVIAAAQGTITDRGLAGVPAGKLSPDGRLVSYFDTVNSEFRVDDVRSRQPVVRLAVSGYVGTSAISWDGTKVAFSAGIPGEGPGLRVLSIPAPPGAVARLLIKGADIDPREWSRDGAQILVGADLSPFEIRLVNAIDGTFRIVKQATSSARFLSPDAAFLAHDVQVAGSGRNRAVGLVPTNGGVEVQVVEPTAWHTVVGWSADGRQLVVFSDRGGFPGLWAIPIRDGRRGGEPRLLKRDLDGNPVAVTASGDVVYERVTGPPAARLVTAGIDTAGRATSAPARYATRDPLAFARFPRWSPDGKSFLYVVARRLGPAIVIHSTEGPDAREIPLPFRTVYTFDWSLDGRSLIFKGRTLEGQFGEFCLCLMDVATGRVRTVAPPGVYYHPRFSTSSTTVSYFKRQDQPPQPARWSYVERDLQSGIERDLVPDLSRLMAEPRSYPASGSPDGRFLLNTIVGDPSRLVAYDTTTAEVREIFRPPGTQAFNHYGDLQWTPDSRAIITTVATKMHAAGNEQGIWWIPIDGRAPRRIDVGTTQIGENPIAIHPDGTRIAFVAGRPFPAVWPLYVGPRGVGSPLELRVLGPVVP
jgi:Tol biopolymer transport system component